MVRRLIFLITVLSGLSFVPRPIGTADGYPPAPVPTPVPHPPAIDTASVIPGEYLWPTDASKRVTSSFAEYRSTHFHGGIDISTNGQTGYNVYAVREGYVCRIVISPVGYGKMLFVRHPDGYVSTYAHLQGFNSAITAVARKEQYRRGTFAISLDLDEHALPVSRGEVIAYSGDSGFGPPHLHFEIRDTNLNPLNPMLCPALRIVDNIPPVIRRLMIDPIGYGSTVDDGTGPRFYSRFPRRSGEYVLPQTVRIHGSIGFGVEATDRSDGTASLEGIHQLRMYVDDSCTYRMSLDRVPAEETKLIDLHYDLTEIVEGHGKFQKLYIDKGNDLPFYDREQPGTGILRSEQLTEGSHAFRIVCTDNAGNTTTLRGTLFANHRPVISLAGVDNRSVVIAGRDIDHITGCIVYGKRAFQTTWSKHSLATGRFERTAEGLVLPVNTVPYDVIKVVAESRTGSFSDPLFRFLKKPAGPARPVHIQTDIGQADVRFTVTTTGVFTDTPQMTVTEGETKQSVPLVSADVNRYTGVYIPADSVVGERTVTVQAEVNARQTTATDGFTVYPIPADRAGSWTVDGGALTVSFDSGAVFAPLLVQVSSDQMRGSTAYTLEPDNVLLDRGIRVTLRPGTNTTGAHAGLFFRSTGGWVWQDKAATTDGEFTTTLSRRLGDLVVLSDETEPAFGRVRVQTRKGLPFVSFRYFDNLSGVDPDAIRISIDDKLVIPDIDGMRRLVTYLGDTPMTRGRHTCDIVLQDRAGNPASIRRLFTVR